ncbi:hypothetical protein [Crocosphaera chwakensis]|uniref:Uncharacterized protein n=1 Tax=Crocosphaera chwakensis CCY0110 TaxID=391612 RepID=A3IMC9_9CHRO|nr:hypothetical protein [Crocosphaera chwakensis]EAZ92298.1 hypothetical protein CY0110_28104 [Crocosphaera chwakensis CCY0110]
MLFQFSPLIEAGIAAGKYAPVMSSGVPIGLARDVATGQFVAHAQGLINTVGMPLNPLISPIQLLSSGAQMYQTHRGFQVVQQGLQSLQASVGVLQATTAVIGVGVAAGVALSAVNLYHTLKLRKAVERLEINVENGFIDLKQVLKDQGREIIQLIEEVAQDIKFEQHRLILVKAYGLFTKALDRLRSALYLQDLSRRNAEIDAARGMLFEALADYTNPQLLEEISAPGILRRAECAWGIEQTIIATYQMQGELSVVGDRLESLQGKIRQDTVKLVESLETEDELDFLFPEISRIRHHDLVVIESWQTQNDWIKALPSEDLKLLQSADFSQTDIPPNASQQESQLILSEPLELSLYKDLQEKSHPGSLRDQLLFMMDSNLRQNAESYISQQASLLGHETLALSNLQIASHLTIANLYWYFK